MKRMSDVFKLPVVANTEESVGSVTSEEIDMSLTVHELASCSHFSAKGRVEARKDAAEAIAHAINHVDALAENLEEALIQIEYLHQKFGETGSGNAVLSHGHSALNAYRGEK